MTQFGKAAGQVEARDHSGTKNQRISNPVRSQRRGTTPSEFDYANLGLLPDIVAHLMASEARMASFGRRSTKETFEIGEDLLTCAALVPEGTFYRWVTGACQISRKQAYNFVGVARELQPLKSRFIDARVGAAVMYKLITASPDQIEQVLGAFESGTRLSEGQVAALLNAGGSDEESVAPANVGGVAGLRSLALSKTRSGIATFVPRIKSVIAEIEFALAPVREGKRVLKGALADKIEVPCRLGFAGSFHEQSPSVRTTADSLDREHGATAKSLTPLAFSAL